MLKIKKILSNLIICGGFLLANGPVNAVARSGLAQLEPMEPTLITGDEIRSIILDNIVLSVQTSFYFGDFIIAAPGNTSQVATSLSWDPYREFSILAVPYGSQPGMENLPVAERGGSRIYEQELRKHRTLQGGVVEPGSTITFFNQQITGMRTSVSVNIRSSEMEPVMIEEWVAEAGDRIWLLRLSRSINLVYEAAILGTPQLQISIGSTDLAQPTTIERQAAKELTYGEELASTNELPYPAWWQGDCDLTNYQTGSGGTPSFRLGAVYMGLPSCGPRPYYDQSPDVMVRFFPGSWGVLEWECVEYSMRYLYLRYGIAPYQANGSQVVWNYSGSLLGKVSNGTVGRAPVPGDVLSYGSTSTFGHTSVVKDAQVDENGNGSITVIEENASASGSSTLAVRNWVVAGNAGSVSGWLHAQWQVEYFNDPALTEPCSLGYENGTYIFKNWEDAPPVLGCDSGGYGARFRSSFLFPGGSYQFKCQHNDGCRLSLDGQIIIYAWQEMPLTSHEWTGSINPGTHEVMVEYFNMGSDSMLETYWYGAGFLPANAECNPNEWCGRYFGNQSLTAEPALVVSEGTALISKDISVGEGIGFGLPAEHISAKWQRSVFFNAERYRFHILVDDGGRLWIGDQLVINQWKDQSKTEYSGEIDLPAGTFPIRFEYFNNHDDGTAHLWWESVTIPLTVSKEGNGKGMITSIPPGIDCGSTCSFAFSHGSVVTLSAQAEQGSFFSGWQGGGCSGTGLCSIALEAARQVTANFDAECFVLNVNSIPGNSGLVQVNSSSLCPDGKYPLGARVSLTPTTTSNFARFVHWGGDYEGADIPLSFIVTENVTVEAHFETSTFSDVPFNYLISLGGTEYDLHPYIQALYDLGLTSGCNLDPLMYCPEMVLNRAMMSKFLLNVYQGTSYSPPQVSGDPIFDDVWNPDNHGNDGSWAQPWVEALYAAGLTSGCWSNPSLFCPWDEVTRIQAAKFGLMMKYGPTYQVPAASGNILADIACLPSGEAGDPCWGTPWAEQALDEGLLVPCGYSGGKPMFCPNDPMSRAWSAYMIVEARNLLH